MKNGIVFTPCVEYAVPAARNEQIDPASVIPPEGEPFAEAQARLMTEIAKSTLRLKADTAVAVVLRPLAWGAVRCALEEKPTSDLWDLLNEPEGVAQFEVPGDRLRAHRPAVLRMFL